jgi:hypothetical protein
LDPQKEKCILERIKEENGFLSRMTVESKMMNASPKSRSKEAEDLNSHINWQAKLEFTYQLAGNGRKSKFEGERI